MTSAPPVPWASPALAAVRLFAVGLLWVGCNGRVFCHTRAEAVTRADGTPAPCLSATDCPRDQNLLVCTDNAIPAQACVACASHQCERVIPEPCP